MNKKLITFFALSVLLVLPIVVLAFIVPDQPRTVPSGAAAINNIVDAVFTILWILAVVFIVIMFTVAGFDYLTSKGEPGKIASANKAVIWGTVGVAVILLAWSILSIVRSYLVV